MRESGEGGRREFEEVASFDRLSEFLSVKGKGREKIPEPVFTTLELPFSQLCEATLEKRKICVGEKKPLEESPFAADYLAQLLPR